MKKLIFILVDDFFIKIIGIIIIIFGFLFLNKKNSEMPPRLIWGPIPLLNNKYWSNALKNSGYHSLTLMNQYWKIFEKDDFDKYLDEVTPSSRYKSLNIIYKKLAPYIAFTYAFNNFDIFHHSFFGGFLSNTFLKSVESFLLKKAGCKIVIIGYGADHYRYSQIEDRSLLHGLLCSYPQMVKKEEDISKNVRYWVKNADIILGGGSGSRWDVLPVATMIIDINKWLPIKNYSLFDGNNGVVKIIHCPNHRGFKGTEFLIHAVNELKDDNILIKLILVENKSNAEVRALIQDADILAEQFIAPTYGLNGIEGMASGLPVLANLDCENYTRVLRRYSYLNECPVLSTTPENLKENLRILITNPKLRKELGQAGRQYIEKYHSEATAQYMFGAIYDKIWHGKDVDLINLFHPIKSEYNNRKPFVNHPLLENKLPAFYE